MIARLARIGWAGAVIAGCVAYEALARPATSRLPALLRRTLEGLGSAFIKLGQALSLREDLFAPPVIVELRRLQDHAAPFPADQARAEVERGLGRPIDTVFATFSDAPLAAASMAQVHRATLPGGETVIVKIRRPRILAEIDRDMRALTRIIRLAERLLPRLRRYQPTGMVAEIWTNLRHEADFRREARNVARFAAAFKDSPTIHIPVAYPALCGEGVLVQAMSGGRTVGDPAIGADGPRLSQALVDAYLHQFFVLGAFHADPHPGNLFIMADGKICLHDFGAVGALDRETRQALGAYLQAFAGQDARWMLDAAIELGLLSARVERDIFVRGIDEILLDFSTLPLREWSIAEALTQVARLGQGGDFRVPRNLLLLMRTAFILESVLRQLDPELEVLDTIIAHGREAIRGLLEGPGADQARARLAYEALALFRQAPDALGTALRRLRRGEVSLPLTNAARGIAELETHLDRTGNRLSLAMVSLGLYVAGSLLMQHSLGPRIWGGLPLLAVLAYGLALWFTWRLARGISRSGRL